MAACWPHDTYPLTPFPSPLCPLLTMSGSKKCPGCLNVFTSQTAHLSQTTNPLCRRIAKKRRSTRSQSVCVLRKQLPKSQTPPLPTSPAVSSQPNSPIPHPLPLLVSPGPRRSRGEPRYRISKIFASDIRTINSNKLCLASGK